MAAILLGMGSCSGLILLFLENTSNRDTAQHRKDSEEEQERKGKTITTCLLVKFQCKYWCPLHLIFYKKTGEKKKEEEERLLILVFLAVVFEAYTNVNLQNNMFSSFVETKAFCLDWHFSSKNFYEFHEHIFQLPFYLTYIKSL